MSEITVSAGNFLRIFDYIERIGLDVDAIVATVNLVPERIARLGPEGRLPAQQYSRLYKAAVLQMQTLFMSSGFLRHTGNCIFRSLRRL